MKLTRVILACTLLLSASFPLLALPVCKDCVNNACSAVPGAIETCKAVSGVCTTSPNACSPPAAASVLADWTVASVEMSCSEADSEIVTIQADVAAVADTAEAQSTEQK